MGDRHVYHVYWLATVLEGPHLATAESLLGEVRGAVVKRLADPEPDSNVALLVGHHPDVVGVKTFGTFMPILTASSSAKPGCAGARCCSRCWWGPERALGGNVARRGAAAGLGTSGSRGALLRPPCGGEASGPS